MDSGSQGTQQGCTRNAQALPERVFVMAIGSLRLNVVERLARQGRMPAFRRILGQGAAAPNLLNLYPNKSHTAWISALTGASAGVHRAISILRSETGAPPFQQDVLGAICQADYLWEAAERQGKNCIVLNFPDCWPPRMKRGIQIGGASLSVNATFHSGQVLEYRGPVHRFALAADELFCTEPGEGVSAMELTDIARIGSRSEGAGHGVAARLPLACRDSDRPLAKKPVLWLVHDIGSSGATICEDEKWESPLAVVEPGKWSPRIDLAVDTAEGLRRAALRVKLLEFDIRRRYAKLYVSPLCALRDGRVSPAGAAPELADLPTFPIPTPVFLQPYSAKWLDPQSQRELLDMNNAWQLDALRALLRRPFELFVFHTNDIDWAEHAVAHHWRSGMSRDECERLIDGAYEDLDRLLAGLLDVLPPGTALLIMSQHGVVEPWDSRPSPSTADILHQAGLLARDSTGAIDYEASRAFPGADGGFVNVRPWRPVSEDEIALRQRNLDETLRVLSAAANPGTGQRVFSVALPWEAAAPFGIGGPREADIMVLRPAPFGGIHGACYPLEAEGESDLRGFLLFVGPGVKAGAREERPVYPEDLAPTAAQLLGIRPPGDCEGRILWRMLQ